MNVKVLLTHLIIFLSIITVPILYAQETPDFGDDSIDPSTLSFPAKYPQIEEQIDVTIKPEIPRPGELVTITVEAYGTDLNVHPISWKNNGVEILKGIGQKKFIFTMGNSGTVTNIDLTISPKNAPLIKRSYTFAPIDVDILWQADTYTPPFYKGKALYTPESVVTFTAIPNILIGKEKIDPSEAVYKWSQDYEVQGDKSGFGKNTYQFVGPIILQPVNIQVQAYAATNRSMVGINRYTLTNVYPQVIAYENSPLYGVLFNKSVNSGYVLKQKEVKLSAFPYFFSTNDKNDKVAYDWALDDSPLDIPILENSTIFRRTDSLRGQAKISIGVTEDSKALQAAGVSFLISYDDEKPI